jgi:hypothetical protein
MNGDTVARVLLPATVLLYAIGYVWIYGQIGFGL